MKIIFLDIDGVLCTIRSHIAAGGGGPMEAIDREAIGLLNQLTRAGDQPVRYVLSSTWRKSWSRNEMSWHLNDRGWRGFFHDDWRTGAARFRGLEVKDWLDRHPEVAVWIALDDDSDFLDEQKARLVKTSCDDGLSWRNFLDANRLLHGREDAWRQR